MAWTCWLLTSVLEKKNKLQGVLENQDQGSMIEDPESRIGDLGLVNPLRPKSDQHQISPCDINAL